MISVVALAIVASLLVPAAGSRVAAAGVARPAALVSSARCASPRCQDVAVAKSEEDVALAFGAALSAAWSSSSTAQLSTMLSPSCTVETPVWNCADRDAYESELAEAREFFSPLSKPALTVLAHKPLGDGRAQLTWQLGVEWPAVWRPRINILGESILTMAPASSSSAGAQPLVTSIVESWHQRPREVFTSQVLPRFRDMASLWCTPTAEHVPLTVVGKGNGYELRRLPPMLCLQAEWIETGDLLYKEQAPLPPFYAFTGQIKRTDWYNCVSPGFVERSFCTCALPGGMSQPGQRRRWFAPLPARFGNAAADELPNLDDALSGDSGGGGGGAGGTDAESGGGAAADADGRIEESLPREIVSASVQHVRRPAQLLAVRRLRGIPSNDLVLATALELATSAEKAGLTVVREGGRPVIMQVSEDVKYGYNDAKELAMSVWLSVPDPLREEYVGVVLDETPAA